MMKCFRLLALGIVVGLGGGVLAATPPSAPAGGEKPRAAGQAMGPAVRMEIAGILDGLQTDGKFDAAADRLAGLFDAVSLLGTERNLDAFRDADFALRMVRQVGTTPEGGRGELLRYLRANDNLARTLAFLIDDEKQAKGAYAVLGKLREKHGAMLNDFANLAAAICVVHDQPFTRRINEVVTKSPEPVAIFEYYTANEKAMLFGVRNVPAELLEYVVDTTASVEDMQWALHKYGGDTAVGRHFFDISYDYDYVKSGHGKKVAAAGYTLPNILRLGGVCADQAYFAMEVGKAIGVPTTYTTASSAEVGHAWVGFLQTQGDRLFWNFDVGRYEEYRGIRGDVEDPQTRRDVPDSSVSLLAELLGSPAHRTRVSDRQASTAVTDAAIRVADAALGAERMAAKTFSPPITDALRAPRKTTTDNALDMLQMALNQNFANKRAWYVVAALAEQGKLTMGQKVTWSNVLLNRCGDKYPDFALVVLAPMIGTVDDPVKQDGLWAAAGNKFQGRSDLAAEILMQRAALWEEHKQTATAGGFYLEIINRYCNAGPFVIGALAKAEELLGDRKEKVVQLYQQSWAKIQKPEDMAGPFMEQSNWFRVGAMYADKLTAAGEVGRAQGVYAALGVKGK